MKKADFDEFKLSLTEEHKNDLLEHFNKIYECVELGEHELKIAYLGYLWDNGLVYTAGEGWYYILKEETGFDIDDYEITFESDESGGANLNLFYDYYLLDKINRRKHFKLQRHEFDYFAFEKDILSFNEQVVCTHPSYAIVWMEKDDSEIHFGPESGRTGLYEEILQGKRLFFPFSSSNVEEVYCANGKSYTFDEDNPIIGFVDCLGFLISFSDGKFDIHLAIHYGGMCMQAPEIELGDCDVLNADMVKFLSKYIKSA